MSLCRDRKIELARTPFIFNRDSFTVLVVSPSVLPTVTVVNLVEPLAAVNQVAVVVYLSWRAPSL